MAIGDIHYSNALGAQAGWVQANAYSANNIVFHLGRTFLANGDIPANSAFSEGSESTQWREFGVNRPFRVRVWEGGESGTFLPNAGAVYSTVQIQAAGGGGGLPGFPTCDAGEHAISCCGGGGAYVESFSAGPINNGNSVTVISGRGGAIGTQSKYSGTIGGASSVKSGAVGWKCNGGTGGWGANYAPTKSMIVAGGVGGTLLGSELPGTTTAFTCKGGEAQATGGERYQITQKLAGVNALGGWAFLGGGYGISHAVGAVNAVSVLVTGGGYGQGGAGAFLTGASTVSSTLISKGAAGIVIITEYF